MTAAPQQDRSSRSSALPVPCHCPEAEYADLIRRQPLSAAWRQKHLACHRRFVRAYPDLAAWPSQPLRQRLGWRGPEGQERRTGPGEGIDMTACWVNFNARHYLTYLALTGRLRLDWGWLLGIGVLKPWLVADQIGLPLSGQAAGLRERLIALGHVRDEESFRLSWALIRLVLHRGDPDLTAVTFEDVEEMRQVIRNLDQVPGISEVIDPARLPSTRAAWGTNAYRAGLALFHGGIISRLPVPYRGLPRPPLSSRPRIAAVMDRFIAERALVLRPESMDGLRGGLRRFGLWLDDRAAPYRVARPADPRRHGRLHAGSPPVPQDQAPGRADQPGLPRRHHLRHRGVLPLRRAVRVGRRPGPAADHPRRHAAPHPAGPPVHPRPPARPRDGAASAPWNARCSAARC